MKIFVVDDEPMSRMLACEELTDQGHAVTEFDNGADFLMAMDQAPDLVLLDIEMPKMDGIAACRQLREDGQSRTVVIFVSAHDDLETRLAAYDAGGNDFIVKPYYPEELAQKVRIAAHRLGEGHALSEQALMAQGAAFTAMSSMSEMGSVLQFLTDSFACATPQALADRVIETFRQYSLNGLIRFGNGEKYQNFSSKGACTPLETSILDHVASLGRLFQFRDRLAINYPGVTLLALDLPLTDPEKVGRLRDHLAILGEGAAARLAAIESDTARLAQAAAITRAVAELSSALADIEQAQARTRFRSMELHARHQEELMSAFVHLGLTEGQEASLADLSQRYRADIEELHEHDLSLGDSLRAITERLKGLL